MYVLNWQNLASEKKNLKIAAVFFFLLDYCVTC